MSGPSNDGSLPTASHAHASSSSCPPKTNDSQQMLADEEAGPSAVAASSPEAADPAEQANVCSPTSTTLHALPLMKHVRTQVQLDKCRGKMVLHSTTCGHHSTHHIPLCMPGPCQPLHVSKCLKIDAWYDIASSSSTFIIECARKQKGIERTSQPQWHGMLSNVNCFTVCTKAVPG